MTEVKMVTEKFPFRSIVISYEKFLGKVVIRN